MTADETRVFAHEDGGREALIELLLDGDAYDPWDAASEADHILGSSWLSGHVAAAVAAERVEIKLAIGAERDKAIERAEEYTEAGDRTSASLAFLRAETFAVAFDIARSGS